MIPTSEELKIGAAQRYHNEFVKLSALDSSINSTQLNSIMVNSSIVK